MVAALSSLIGFVISFVVGAFGIYAGGRVIADVDDYVHAAVTAAIGSAVWFVISFFIPFVGGIIALVAYIYVLNRRYPGGWLNAIGIALIAWVAAGIVLFVLASVGIGSFEAIGVPNLF